MPSTHRSLQRFPHPLNWYMVENTHKHPLGFKMFTLNVVNEGNITRKGVNLLVHTYVCKRYIAFLHWSLSIISMYVIHFKCQCNKQDIAQDKCWSLKDECQPHIKDKLIANKRVLSIKSSTLPQTKVVRSTKV